ncbi:MAG: Fis family transcriptional regulator [Planctomycetota bacterium]|nr:MAG: Fis family transcriptional regulator [Planctomycetota bacterium]
MEKEERSPARIPPETASAILESMSEGVYAVDREFRITLFNRAAERITGVPRSEAVGRYCWEVFRSEICESDCHLRLALDSEQPVARTVWILDSEGRRIPVSMSSSVLRDREGNVTGGVVTFRDLSTIEELKREAANDYAFCEIISRNRRMRELFEILPDVAESDSPVLVTGESGTGKELVARALHRLSRRAKKPLVVVNCGALPDTLLESELFGHVKGAFTDAKRDRKGRFELADGGTIFLDEIGDISAALQVRLLRVLQEGTFEPVGSSHTRKADVRVIAATNKDLKEEMEAGRFRSDLYYRLNVMEIRLPPLRERKEDIPLLAAHFIERFNRRRNRNVAGLSPDALELMLRYDWPGNIRELENAIEHAFILCRSGFITPGHLPPALRAKGAGTGSPLPGTLAEMERNAIVMALEASGRSRKAAARLLGIHPTTLWRKMKRYGIE